MAKSNRRQVTLHRGRDTGLAQLTAVLGPTNTGKTHFAIERMLAHRSGMIGLPLRLLAREVYDKIVRLKGQADVALITGEERIVPAHPRFYVCTVEAMPVDIPVAFLAVDEIQLCADPERGHVFTDRLLHARGQEETMFLGAATMRNAIARFVPGTHFISRPRFSDLAYTGARKLTRLPRRSAIVAFSAEDVYGLADLVRQQRGGAAVVMGALSPRTRNAQVALYQSGDVDFLIATDAIGMGINMDVDHVAFAERAKFDGVAVRPLRPEEVGQIAGRAGRYMNDGTFGVTGEAEPFEPELVAQVENHRYDPVRVLQWRNTALDFSGMAPLLTSLDAPPPMRGLARARPASDHWTLRLLSQDEDIAARVAAPQALSRLWEACQLPDFRKLTPDEHARLVAQIFGHLMTDSGVLPEDWMARQIARLDVTEGEVDTLSARLAQIRTWTYAAHRKTWTKDAPYWQETTRAVEDRLSDALHEKLTQRFIDRRTAVLMRHMREDTPLSFALDDSGAVSAGGEHIGKMEGFRFAPDPRAEGIHGRTLRAVALKGLEGEIEARAAGLIVAPNEAITLSEHAQLWWSGAVVGRLAAGRHPLVPNVTLAADDHLKGARREAVQARLETFVQTHIATLLEPLIALKNAVDGKSGLPASSRGLGFQLAESFGHLDRDAPSLTFDMREAGSALRLFGVRVGHHAIYLPKLLRPAPAALLAMLWAVWHRLPKLPSPPAPGLTSFAIDDDAPPGFLFAAGFRVLGRRAVRTDIVERLGDLLHGAARSGSTEAVTSQCVSLLGAGTEETEAVIEALGWSKARGGWIRNKTKKEVRKSRGRASGRPNPETPFSGLAALISAD